VLVLEPGPTRTALIPPDLRGAVALAEYRLRYIFCPDLPDLKFILPTAKAFTPSALPPFDRPDVAFPNRDVTLTDSQLLGSANRQHRSSLVATVIDDRSELRIDEHGDSFPHGQTEYVAIASPCRPRRVGQRDLHSLRSVAMV